jgi:ribose transport system permease protein
MTDRVAPEFVRSRLHANVTVILIFLVTAVAWGVAIKVVPGLSSGRSVEDVIVESTILGLAAAGQTFVIISGGIDLSIPWVMTGSALLMTTFTDGNEDVIVWALPLVLLLALAVGITNGLGVAVAGVPPIIMTLAMNVILSAAVTLYVGPSPPSTSPSALVSFAQGAVLGIPSSIVTLFVLIVVGTLMLTFLPFGRRLYAFGSSHTVARFSGIGGFRQTVSAYALSSLAASVAGLMLLGYYRISYPGMADAYQFSSVAAVVVGGASILGGSGHILGTIAGAILLTVISTILIVYSLGQGTLLVFYGVTILASVWIASFLSRSSSR